MGQGSPIKLVKTHGKTKLGKGPRKPKARKWVEDAQGKANGTQKPIGKETHGHAKPLGKEYTAGLKRAGRIKSL